MLGQFSQVDSNIQNNTSIKSQKTVPQVTRHQTPNTFINVFIFQMSQYGIKKRLNVSVFESTKTLNKSSQKDFRKNEKPFDNTLFINNRVHMTYAVKV